MAQTAPICDFGRPALDFDLEGTDGKRYGLQDVKGANGLLVMFICNHCPYVKAILERLVRDTGELKSHGVGSVGIMPNDTQSYPDDSFDSMKRVAERYGFPFPYVIDRTQEVARAYEAVCTPDFFGFNKDLELQYRGRLDVSRTTPVANARRELFEAMLGIARTGRGPEEQTASLGCSIKWRHGG